MLFGRRRRLIGPIISLARPALSRCEIGIQSRASTWKISETRQKHAPPLHPQGIIYE